MTVNNFAEIVSLLLTSPTIILALGVLWCWVPKASIGVGALSYTSREVRAHHYLLIGIIAGFLGSAVDNLYWALAWTGSFLDKEHPITEWLFSNGVWPNIVFRQGLGIVAAYCHLRAFVVRFPGSKQWFFMLMLVSVYVAILATILLFTVKYYG